MSTSCRIQKWFSVNNQTNSNIMVVPKEKSVNRQHQ